MVWALRERARKVVVEGKGTVGCLEARRWSYIARGPAQKSALMLPGEFHGGALTRKEDACKGVHVSNARSQGLNVATDLHFLNTLAIQPAVTTPCPES